METTSREFRPAGKSVLCVEDDQDICELMEVLLDPYGYRIDSVNSMGEAMDRVDSCRYDAFIVDGNLPDGKGLDLCRHIRTIHTDARIIMISGMELDEIALKRTRLDADAFFPKPFDFDSLVSTLDRLAQH